MADPAVVLVHNRYQNAGGEDAVFAAERALLVRNGHRVRTYVSDNRVLARTSHVRAAATTFWNARARRAMRRICTADGPVVAHFHNTFPLISPAAYYGARAAGAAVVQTLHNYRLLCPGATLYRQGGPCEACVGQHLAWPAVVHGCYRDSRAATAVTAAMVAVHRAAGTWQTAVTTYVALSEFARRKFIEGGLPEDRIVVKPNFLAEDPGTGEHQGGFALFVGRLSPEKGLETLLRAWAPTAPLPLKVAGTGPGFRSSNSPDVEWLGWLPPEEVIAHMKQATVLIVPSTCYEGSPMTVLQAFATGLPVIASGHGSLAEIVVHGRTGYHVRPAHAADLAAAVAHAAAHPGELAARGRQARAVYEQQYTAERHYTALRTIYRDALAIAAGETWARDADRVQAF